MWKTNAMNFVNTSADWLKGVLFLYLNAFAAFFAPIAWVAVLVGLATIIDMGFAIWRTKKLKGKVTSQKMRKGFISKTFVYVAVVLFVFALDHYIIGQILDLFIQSSYLATKIFALVLVLIEIYSIDESYKEVTGKSFLSKFFKIVRKAHKAKDEIKGNTEI